MSNSRRDFIKKAAFATAGAYVGASGFSAQSYGRILGANDRVRVGVIGFSRSLQRLPASGVPLQSQTTKLRYRSRF
jgi:hypothetical protein